MVNGSDYDIRNKSKSNDGISYRDLRGLNESDRRKLAIFNENLKAAIELLPPEKKPRIYPQTLSERIAIIPLFCTADHVRLLEENSALRGITAHAKARDPKTIHLINAAKQAAARCPQTVRPKGQRIAQIIGAQHEI